MRFSREPLSNYLYASDSSLSISLSPSITPPLARFLPLPHYGERNGWRAVWRFDRSSLVFHLEKVIMTRKNTTVQYRNKWLNIDPCWHHFRRMCVWILLRSIQFTVTEHTVTELLKSGNLLTFVSFRPCMSLVLLWNTKRDALMNQWWQEKHLNDYFKSLEAK